ncbi:hypothetical protein ACCO45_004078 [Purpureocillium lilacinum]|uniref:Uncharacterized protein n=1 Tax=Purpureocillium lilacinum TaxID=33203 RepID=A0ACC4E4H5_PURLI
MYLCNATAQGSPCFISRGPISQRSSHSSPPTATTDHEPATATTHRTPNSPPNIVEAPNDRPSANPLPRTSPNGPPPTRRALRACTRQPIASSRTFSVSARRQGGGHGSESQFDPPTGWLWGIKPGEKAETEGWEWPMYLFCGSLLATGIALAFKPDTTVSTWALEEARRRLEAEGILPDPSPEKKN